MDEESIISLWIHSNEKQTGRTETSKYPEEKKSTEISLVAASERELALKFPGS